MSGAHGSRVTSSSSICGRVVEATEKPEPLSGVRLNMQDNPDQTPQLTPFDEEEQLRSPPEVKAHLCCLAGMKTKE